MHCNNNSPHTALLSLVEFAEYRQIISAEYNTYKRVTPEERKRERERKQPLHYSIHRHSFNSRTRPTQLLCMHGFLSFLSSDLQICLRESFFSLFFLDVRVAICKLLREHFTHLLKFIKKTHFINRN